MSKEEIILTVSEITSGIKLSLEKTFPSITVQGEVSNFKKQSSGHLYFSLKDALAQISCVMFKGDTQGLQNPFKEGDSIIIKGALNVYPPGGRYQIVVKEVKRAGIGELLIKLEELKTKIRGKGWFDKKHKKPLPPFPKRIGIVTSPTGAVIQDILHIMERRFSGLQIILNPVKVQGVGAALEIARAIREFNIYQLADVLIVGRGGGSIEDLFSFNEEVVAEAIFESSIPIICAVGHETDHCIAEYVADQRAPTPSAAAELIVPEKREFIERLDRVKKQCRNALKKQVSSAKTRLEYIRKVPFFKDPYVMTGEKEQELDGMQEVFIEKMRKLLKDKRRLLEQKAEKLNAEKPHVKLMLRKQKLQFFHQTIENVCTRKIAFYRKKLDRETLAFNRLMGKYLAEKKERFQEKRELKHLSFAIKRIFLQRRKRLDHIEEIISSLNPKNLLNRGYSILFSEKDHSIINSVCKLQMEQTFKIMLSDGEAAATISNSLNHQKTL